MAIFDRIRRHRHAAGESSSTAVASLPPVPAHLLPEVNQRVSITMGEHVPVPTRVDDIVDGMIVLAAPSLALEFGDAVVMTWETDGAWSSLDTRVLGVDHSSTVPTVRVASAGRLSRYDERRADVRRSVELPIDLKVVRARALRPGRELQTRTSEVSSSALRFVTSAPFAPGDVVELRIRIGSGADDVVGARVRVIRIDAVTGSWRSTCTATFEEMLRTDKARLLAVVSSSGTARDEVPVTELPPPPPTATPTTADGVGGRDEPEPVGTFDDAVAWLRRRS